MRASTALSFPDLGRFPIIPSAAFWLLSASTRHFGCVGVASAGPARVWSWVFYKPIVSLATVAFNATVVYYASAIRASRFYYMQQGKRIPVLVAADAAAKQHRRVIWLGAIALTCANVGVLGLGMSWAFALLPADAAPLMAPAYTAEGAMAPMASTSPLALCCTWWRLTCCNAPRRRDPRGGGR